MAGVPRAITPLVIAALLAASLGTLATPRTVAAWTSGSFSTTDEDLLVQLTNTARAAAGRAPLRVNSQLHSLAESRSKDMVDRDYFSHNIPPDGHLVFHDMDLLGIKYSWAAENIGWNTYSDSTASQSMFDWFMGSSAHKANILDPRATDIGVGAYKGTFMGYANAHVYTMLFIQAPSGDTTPPTVTAPATRLYSVSTLGSTTVPGRTTWSGSDASGVASYLLQRQVNAGSWATVTLSSATAKSIAQSLTLGATYRYRVRATDTHGNVSLFAYGPTYEPVKNEDISSSVTWAGSWSSSAVSTASGGTLKYATAAGASASLTFTGSSVAWVSYKGPTRGSASVYLDGVFYATVSLYASTSIAKQIAYAAAWGSSGVHTIKVVVAGTAGHPRVDVDAFVRLINL